MNILGIVDVKEPAHDNSVVILKDGKIVFAEAGERSTRRKHDDNLPVKCLEIGLKTASLEMDDIDYVAVASPNPKFSSLIFGRNYGMDTLIYLSYIFLKSPRLLFRDVFTRIGRMLYKGAYIKKKEDIELLGLSGKKVVRICHETCHAAAAYYGSGTKEKCLAISLDGCGPRRDGKIISGAIFICENGRMKKVEEVPAWATLGGFYGAVTQVLGLKAGDGEYKTMGLASYGDHQKCYQEIKEIHPYFDGQNWRSTSFWPDFFSVMNKEVFEKTRLYSVLEKLKKKYKDEDIAAALQKVFEERVIEYIRYLSEKYEIKKFVCGGGIFLNIVLNRKIVEQDFCDYLYVYPSAGDSGVSLGAAYYFYYNKTGKIPEKIDSLYLGTGFKEEDYEAAIKKFEDKVTFEKSENISRLTARKLTEGKVIGWFQGRAEWGPRALGNRSVLADPRKKETKDRINATLKARDWFMPFGPSMLYEAGEEYLELIKDKEYFTDYMLLAFKVKPGMDKFPAAIHIDNTARPQMVKKEINSRYYGMIAEFGNITGVPVVLNTSFNKHGLPIVHSPEDALNHLDWGCIEALAMGDYYIEKKK